MMNRLPFLRKFLLRRSRTTALVQGFTLIELLVAMVIASFIVVSLLGFMNNILETDRKEQAKANTEQEIQQALDFIGEDLREAVYIYDNDGLSRNADTTTPDSSGIRDQIPPVEASTAVNTECATATATAPVTCTPILVFWKREYRSGVLPLNFTGPSGAVNNYNRTAAPFIGLNTACTGPVSSRPPGINCATANDSFVYSLVAYYLITTPNPTWQGAARIGRFVIRDGIKSPPPTNSQKTLLDATYQNNVGTETATATGNVALNPANFNYLLSTGSVADCPNASPPDGNCPSPGFRLFDLGIGSSSLKGKMNSWLKGTANYTAPVTILLDHIDQSGVPAQGICTGDPSVTPGALSANAQWIISTAAPISGAPTSTPPYSAANPPITQGFYACVDATSQVARVYLRGNALTRIIRKPSRPSGSPPDLTGVYTPAITCNGNCSGPRAAYFPTNSLQPVQSRGYLNLN